MTGHTCSCGQRSRVIQTRERDGKLTRQRGCTCGQKWWTVEVRMSEVHTVDAEVAERLSIMEDGIALLRGRLESARRARQTQ